MTDLFHSEQPKAELLKSHIAYYYFHQMGDDHSPRSFVYYPHYKNAITIYKDSSLIFENEYATVTKPKKCGYSFGFAKLTSRAAKATIYAPFNKIGIVFQPLGLNHFLADDLCNYLDGPIKLGFDYFKPTMAPVLDKVYKTNDVEQKVKLLDDYFLAVYTGFNSPKMQEAMQLLLAHDAKLTVEELAQKLGVSRKTVHRLFRKHQNCSAIDYIKLIQFRRSIENFKSAADKSTLTKLAHDTQYYDQSDFIRHFKKLTGFNPSSFFRDLSDVGNQGTYWTFD